MPTTTIVNRPRIPPEMWAAFLDTCAETGQNYKVVLLTLIGWYIMEQKLPPSGNIYNAPMEIPRQKPVKSADKFMEELLDEGLFS